MKDVMHKSIKTDIVWLGKAQEDAYYQHCSQKFELIDFDDVYKMTADLLTCIDAKAVVINSSAFSNAYNEIIVPLAKFGVVGNIFVYSLGPVFSFSKPNGKRTGVKFASSPSELMAMLKEFITEPSEPVKPTVKVKEQAKQSESDSEKKPFVPAELTADELQALLGPDYMLEIDLPDNRKKGGKR